MPANRIEITWYKYVRTVDCLHPYAVYVTGLGAFGMYSVDDESDVDVESV